MKTVEEIAREIVAREGGFVNDPDDDPGGATNFGVTIHTMRRLGLDLDGDGDVDVADVRKITSTHATKIFLDHYFGAPNLDQLPKVLQPSVFDMYVNAGANAVKILQRLINDMGFPCVPDGVLGPKTQDAVNAAYDAAPNHIADAYGIARRNYYYRLGDARPASRKYARRRDGGKGGWIKRAEEFISPAFHFSRSAHNKRTAKWV